MASATGKVKMPPSEMGKTVGEAGSEGRIQILAYHVMLKMPIRDIQAGMSTRASNIGVWSSGERSGGEKLFEGHQRI